MNLTSKETIQALLQRGRTKPNKTMGQNFLIDARVLEKIIQAAAISKEDTVLEVGPGIGTLTQALAQQAKQVIAIEKDPAMIAILKQTLAGIQNVQIIPGDVRQVSHYPLPKNYSVVANIPYYLTSHLIRSFLEEPPNGQAPKEILLMVQKEVAQRICAKPPKMSLLAVSVQWYAKASIVAIIPRGSFWPAPAVDSAIIKITPLQQTPSLPPNQFFRVVKAGFSHPRKQLANNFSQAFQENKETIGQWLQQQDIQPNQRAQTLSVAQWEALAKSYSQLERHLHQGIVVQ